jgi:hypothetical protein
MRLGLSQLPLPFGHSSIDDDTKAESRVNGRFASPGSTRPATCATTPGGVIIRRPMALTQADLLALADRTFIKNYRQQPMVLAHGRGSEVWDLEGKRYLDMTAGIAVNCLGHAHPAFVERLRAQLGRLIHVSNLYWNDQEILAAQAITERSFADRVFFCNSGGEANEAALKLARRYQQVVAGQPARTTIISTTGSFHGRTVATVSVTGQAKYRDGFGPMFGPVEFVPFGDLAAASAAIARPEACAMIVEPIQAEGGLIVPPDGYLRGLRAACDAAGVVLIFDEVQTGTGRTGRWWGHDHEGVAPDVMTLAKGLGGGVPIGCLAVTERAAAGLTTPDRWRGASRLDLRRQPLRDRGRRRGDRDPRGRRSDRRGRAPGRATWAASWPSWWPSCPGARWRPAAAASCAAWRWPATPARSSVGAASSASWRPWPAPT